MTPVEEAARAWHEAGASVLPAQRGKRPAWAWADHQQNRIDQETLERLGHNYPDGFGIVTGYGGFEMLEIEGAAMEEVAAPLTEALAEAGYLSRLMTYAERTPSGGIHWVYRVANAPGQPEAEQEGSTKLARSTTGKTMVETRGRFAWTVMAPSGGSIHEEIPGGQWEIIAGHPGVVATFTEEEIAAIYDICRTFDSMPAPAPVEHRERHQPLPDGSVTPGDDYNARMTWEEVLEPLGWTHTPGRGPDFWTRPGKRFGVSARITAPEHGENFYVFSSSAYPFEERQSYTKFGVYNLTQHNGNWTEATRALSRQGYGTKEVPTRILNLVPPPSAPASSTPPIQDAAVRVLEPDVSVPITLTDHGNALLLAGQAEHKLLYSPERKMWMHWTGSRWEWEAGEASIVQTMRNIADSMQPTDEAEKRHKIKSLSKKSIFDTIALARYDDRLMVTLSELDADPYALNTPDGEINLLTGQLSTPTPASRHSRITGVGVDFQATCPRWIKFLEETFADHPEFIPYLQRLAGYSATGTVTHQILPFLNGPGANGKSVFMDVMLRILGGYAAPAPANFLLVTQHQDASAVANLAGMRLVVCSEVGPTAKFDEQKVKDLTGGDPITARFLYANQFTFTPSHHLWLMGNHQPRLDAGGVSFWRRMKLIGFNRIVPEEKRIVGLAEQLVDEEGPAILAWMVAGAMMQAAGGLQEPDSVRVATFEYAEEEDALGRFLQERVKLGGGAQVRVNTKAMRSAYEQWCATEGIRPLPASPFGRELKTRGIEMKPSNSQRWYLNVTLLNSEEEPDLPEQTRF